MLFNGANREVKVLKNKMKFQETKKINTFFESNVEDTKGTVKCSIVLDLEIDHMTS